MVGSQPAEGCLGHLPDVLRTAIGTDQLLAVESEAELGGEDNPIPFALKAAADQVLVGERAVRFSRVEEGDAELDGTVERGDRLGVVQRPVRLTHSHATEAESGDLESLAAEFAGGKHKHPFVNPGTSAGANRFRQLSRRSA
jgi:hypothetical protein